MEYFNSIIDTKYFRSSLGQFSTGVAIITTTDNEGIPIGITINSFNSVSLEPPIILWSIAKKSPSLVKIMTTSCYVIHILGANQSDLAMRFSFGEQSERFRNIPTYLTNNGTLAINLPMAAFFECKPYKDIPAGDHIVLISYVIDCKYNQVKPLIFHNGNFDLSPK